jgi:transposase
MSKPEILDPIPEVLRLHFVEGLSIHAIGKRMKMSRKTVRKALGRGLPPRSDVHIASPRRSMLDPFDDVIRKLLRDTPEMLAPAVLERLRPLGYIGAASILRDRISKLRQSPRREAFLSLHFPPASAVQVDWADFGFAIPGCPRRVSAFVMVLCYSRYLYIEFTLSQAMGTFLRCMERGLAFFGGTTLADIFDNMKTVVQSHTRVATVFNPRFIEYARTRGFAIKACNVGKGNEKGRVERPIGFVRKRFWPGRRFTGIDDLNLQAKEWRDSFANGREHEDTGKIPSLVFEHEERALLRPVRDVPFDADDLLSTGVTKLFRVAFDRNHYSVPWRLASQSVLARGDDTQVRVLLGTKTIACHARSWSVGAVIEDPAHCEGILARKPRAATGTLPVALLDLGETGERYFKILAAGSRSIQRESLRLTLLAELFTAATTASAMDEVMRTGHVGCEYVEFVIRHKRGLQPTHEPLRLHRPDLDSITLREPDLSLYDSPVKTLDPGTPADEQEDIAS